MDSRKLIEILKATIDPEPINRKQAEEQLNQVKKKSATCAFFFTHQRQNFFLSSISN